MGQSHRLSCSVRALALCMLIGGQADAQGRPASLTGAVRDSSGAGVSLVQMTLFGQRVITDTAGRFRFRSLPTGAGTLTARRLGFAPRDTTMAFAEGRADSVFILMIATARELEGVTTEAQALLDVALASFYRHKRVGNGHFFERSEFEKKRNLHKISDLLRSVPGLRLTTDRFGRQSLRVGRSVSGRDCPPDFWVDGVRAQGLNVDDVSLEDVQALEVYGGPAGVPPEMNSRLGNPGCGTIVIWTRVPG